MAKKNERNLNVTIKNQDDNKDEVVISISAIMKNLKRFLAAWIVIAIIAGLLTFSLSAFKAFSYKTPTKALVSFTYSGIEKGLDPKGREEILDELRKLHEEQGITIVLVSHSMEDVAAYAKRVIVMKDGAVMYDDTPEKVFSHRVELEEIGLSVPQVTKVMEALKAAGIPVKTGAITVEEAKSAIREVLR